MGRGTAGAGPSSRHANNLKPSGFLRRESARTRHGLFSPFNRRLARWVGRGSFSLALFFCANVFATQLTLTWSDNSSSEAGFLIERAVNSSAFSQIAAVGTNVTKYVDSSVLAGSTYSYRVRAYNSTATSAYSNATTITVPSVSSSSITTATATVIPSRLVHVSARAVSAPWGSAACNLHFTIANASKSILLRMIGPGLSPYLTATYLGDPHLSLYDGTTLIKSNDNWGGSTTLSSTFSRVGAFPLPTSSLDSAILTTLGAKNYSAVGGGKSAGMSMAEIYDADTAVSPAGKLVKVFARAPVGTGSAVLVAGFAINGNTTLHLLIRAVGGPSLLGLTGLLANPQLSIYHGSTLVKHNDNWGGTSSLLALFTKVGATTLSLLSQDAAVDVTLSAGTYTAVVSGVNSTTGIAQAEFYVVP